MTATPPKRTNTLLRVMMSAVLVAFALFVAQYRKSTERAKSSTPTSTKPFLSKAPSSEGANRFAWVPPYPGAALKDINTRQTRDQLSYGLSFHTADDSQHVVNFYRERLQAAGFKVEVTALGDRGGELHATTDAGARSFDAIATKALQGTGTEVGVTAVQR